MVCYLFSQAQVFLNRTNSNLSIFKKELKKSVNLLSSNYIRKTFKVEENILNAFLDICDKSDYAQQELISKALLEFINNYQS